MECHNSYDQLTKINISEYNIELWKNNRQPLSVTFEVTPKCNFKCIHCYLGKCRYEKTELSLTEIKYILDQLSDVGALFVTLSGGECMDRTDFRDIYLYAKKKGFMVCVFTNGYSFNDDIFELFSEYPPFYVDISLYGASNQTYQTITGVSDGFDVVMKNINELKRRNIEFGIKTPLFKQNISDYKSMCDICEKLNVKYRFSFALSPTINKEMYPQSFMVSTETMIRLEAEDPIYNEMGRNYASVENLWGKAFDTGKFVPLYICAPGVNDMFINYKGEVMPCASFRSEAKSILETPLSEVWKEFAKFKCIPATAKNKCMRCKYRYYCRVCPADQLQYHGDAESVDPKVCAHAQARYMLYKEGKDINDVISLVCEG